MRDHDAMLARSKRLPPLTWEQRDKMLVAAGQVLMAEIGQGASPVAVRPLFDLLFTPPKPARTHGRPSKAPSVLFPSKIAKRLMAARRRRQRLGAGHRGPLPHSALHLSAYDAECLFDMVEAVRGGAGKFAAAYEATGKPNRAAGEKHPADVSRLVRSYNKFSRLGLMDDLPRMLLHRRISAALATGDIEDAQEMAARMLRQS
jgi:hypothetical protein